jgi:hypothetical protein
VLMRPVHVNVCQGFRVSCAHTTLGLTLHWKTIMIINVRQLLTALRGFIHPRKLLPLAPHIFGGNRTIP